ncbi:ATP-binding cassette domain-containing protein [Mycoplasmoides pirum]|uniref:ATP-binding cassette domain-containing protein n=1 Tax=Mycoplasmoides pirum TaxID=2122 RepID=UPI00047F70C1|nr:ATP-binding cassette domain-containing protein [Mycoplasmoides pirum]
MFKKQKIVSPLKNDEFLSVSNLMCIFNEKTPDAYIALSNINYTFKKNKIYCIIGDSGSGKSTLVTHFNGLLVSKYGEIWVKNFHLGGKKTKIKNVKKLRKIISMVFQFPEYQLFKDTVEHDIMFGPVALGASKQDGRRLAEKYLKKMGLDNSYLEKSPFELSGGQKRRVAIAGILAIESEAIIFDEPTAGLDPQGENEMMQIILESKAKNKTVFVITHQMEKVLEIADEIIVLSKGQIINSGTPYQIFTNKDLLKSTTIITPPVIRVIDDLVAKDERFKKLYDYEPRTVDELSKAINKVISEYVNV